MYKVFIEKRVEKALALIPEPDYSRLKKAILALANDPRPFGCKKLKGRPGYRIRQGNYRVIYEIHDPILSVYVIAVGNRKDIYER
jgi:mRNA interferase RelE/StbE